MIQVIERDEVQKYIINTLKVTPIVYKGQESPIRYETIIMYTGKYDSPLDGKFYSCHSFDEALIKHNEFLHEVIERLARLSELN